jgi:hypothetical protein
LRFFIIVLIFSASLLSFTTLLPYQNANAEEFVIQQDKESIGCSSIGGDWSESNKICYTSNLVIEKNDSLNIDSSFLVVLTGTAENNGKIFINNESGSILFAGTFINNEGALFENHGIPKNSIGLPENPDYEIQIGTITNYGTIDNFGGFTMSGEYEIIYADTPNDFVVMDNYGTINNSGVLGFNPGSVVNNIGHIENKGLLSVSALNNGKHATLNNSQEGTLRLQGVLNNEGALKNDGSFVNLSCKGTVNDSGTITGNPLSSEECSEAREEPDVSQTDTEGGGCLIATAAYGTELAPQVQLLREVRDNTVMSTNSGIAFMTGFNQLYYSFSPTIADWERENPVFQESVRLFITPMMSTLSIMSLAEEESEFQVLSAGISVIMLNLGMYVAAPAIVAFKLKNKI